MNSLLSKIDYCTLPIYPCFFLICFVRRGHDVERILLASPAKVGSWCGDQDMRHIPPPQTREPRVASHPESESSTLLHVTLPYFTFCGASR